MSYETVAVELTRSGVSTFAAIGAVIPGEARLLGSSVGIGFTKINGVCKVTAAVPGTVSGTLSIEQSISGTAWEQIDSYVMALNDVLSFTLDVVGRYVRARFTVPAGEVYTVMFSARMIP
jgi:hypothetical protein